MYTTDGVPVVYFFLYLLGWKEKNTYLCSMKEIFGKWFLDVAKYILTVLFLSSVIKEMEQSIIIVIIACGFIVSLFLGIILLKKSEKEKKALNKK